MNKVSEVTPPIMEACLPIQLKNREKGICLTATRRCRLKAIGCNRTDMGSSQNDLVFSSMLLFSHQTDVLCRGVSIDNESDQAT